MREFDADGLTLAKYQAEIFSASVIKVPCSSPVFLRRFFNSDFAKKLDHMAIAFLSLDVDEAFCSLTNEFGESSYGKEKYPAEALYWVGYITRYISYTRCCSSFFVYKTFPMRLLVDCYPGFHTQSEEWAIDMLLSKVGKTEEHFDPNARLKEILKRERGYGDKPKP